MKRYYQILVRCEALHPTGGEPYRFKTLTEAKDALEMCYGLDSLKTFTKIVSSTKE